MIRLAGEQHGVVARWQLRDLGMPDSAVRARIRDGAWTARTDEILVRVGAPSGRGQRALAAVLDAGRGALLSHRSAASWWRVPGPRLVPLTVTTTTHSRRRSGLAVVRVVRSLPTEWTTTLDGVPIVRPELLALQLFASEPYGRAERWVERLWSLRLLDGRSIARFLEAMGRRGRNGTVGLRRYLAERPAPYRPSDSGVELRVRSVLRTAGFRVRAQVDSGSSAEWTGRVDLRDEELPLILEVQSHAFHDALVDRESDARRLAALRAAGFVVVEATDDEAFNSPEVVVERYRAGWHAARRIRSGAQNRADPLGSAQRNG